MHKGIKPGGGMKMRRFTVYATPDANGRPQWQVMDRNVLCDPVLYSDRQDALDSAKRRQDDADAERAALRAKRVGWGHDHKFEPGAYGVCRRCGEEQHP